LQRHFKIFSIHEFIIFYSEHQALRTFEKEGQIQPLGINGEGLFKVLKFLSSDNQQQLNEIKNKAATDRLVSRFLSSSKFIKYSKLSPN